MSASSITEQINALTRQLRILMAERTAHMRKLRSEGATLEAIAAQYGITKQRVMKIVK